MLKRIIPVIAFLLAIPVMVMAQITTSSISGTVTGAANEPLAGASVTALHQPSGTKYATTTRAGGVFNIQNMRVGGPYLIEITFVGYKPEKIEDVTLQVAETYQLAPILIKTDATLENVLLTTTRRNTILNAGRTGAVTNISRREITVLPNITRSLADLSRIAPQANGQAVGGGNARQNNVTVDGSDFNNTFGIASGGTIPAKGTPISLDAIEEFSVSITPFDVRQSGFIGSAINAVTRSGTNTISGSVYNYFRNEKQTGRIVDKAFFKRQIYNFNQKGFRIGGPIIKNKLFYFFNYETEKEVVPGQTKLAATAAAPFGSRSDIARPTTTELDAIRAYLLSKYQYETGPYDNYNLEGEKKKILARLDWNISLKNKLSLRYSQVESVDPAFMNSSTTGSGATFPTGVGRNDINALHFKNSNFYQAYNFYSFAAELNSTLSSKISNTFRANYNNQNEPRTSDSKDFPFVDILKDGQVFTSFGYEPFTYGNLRDVKIYSFVDNLTINLGKNNILIGLQYDNTKTVNGFQPYGSSYYRFNSFADFQNDVVPTDFAYTYSLNKDFSQAFSSFKFSQFSAFVQDEITVSKLFKLTLGLRADRSTYPDVAAVKENPLISALTFDNGIKVNTGTLPKTKILFSPRIGFNWDFYGDRSLQIRGGTGIFTGRVPYVWIVGQSANSGMIQLNQTFNGSTPRPGPFNPGVGFYRPPSPPTPGTAVPTGVTAFAPDFKMPQTWKTSLAIDIKMPGGIIATLEGIYNRDYNVIYSKNINLVPPSPLNVAGYPDNRMIYPVTTNAANNINRLTGSGGVFVPSATGITGLSMVLTGNEKKGHYASFSMKLDKTFKKGFAASVAYTKSIANSLYDGAGDQPFNLWSIVQTVNGGNTPSLSYANYVVPDRVIASISYRKEYFKHLATTIALIYQGSIDGRYSYVYGADFNRDGVNGNDLIYIPKNASEISFSGSSTPNSNFTYPNGVTYTPQQMSDLFFKYIDQDKYLSKHKGQYAERNGAQIPWRNQVDMKFLQDLFLNVGKNRNTVQFSIDIFNLGNLLNSSWGKVKTINASSILVPTNQGNLVPGGAVKPTFRLQTDRNNPVTNTFRDNFSNASTYNMQFGLRYLFN